jgi:hypothetical protein
VSNYGDAVVTKKTEGYEDSAMGRKHLKSAPLKPTTLDDALGGLANDD